MLRIKSRGPAGHEVNVTIDGPDGPVDIPCFSVEIRLDPNDINKALLFVPVGEIDLEFLADAGVIVQVEE